MKQFVKNLISIFMLLLFWLIGWWLFRVRNKTTIIGLENLPKQTGLLLLSNHQSLVDSMLIGYALFDPHEILSRYRHIPWNAAAWENFFHKKVLLRTFCYFLKTIPAYRQLGPKLANQNVREYDEILRQGNLLLFFEGTRSRNGDIGPCVYGPAKIIAMRQPTTIPIKIEGMDKVMPISAGFKWHHIKGGKKITIKVGKPMEFKSLTLDDIRQTVQDSVKNL